MFDPYPSYRMQKLTQNTLKIQMKEQSTKFLKENIWKNIHEVMSKMKLRLNKRMHPKGSN